MKKRVKRPKRRRNPDKPSFDLVKWGVLVGIGWSLGQFLTETFLKTLKKDETP